MEMKTPIYCQFSYLNSIAFPVSTIKYIVEHPWKIFSFLAFSFFRILEFLWTVHWTFRLSGQWKTIRRLQIQFDNIENS